VNIADFLLDRIAEDEAVARDATWLTWSVEATWVDGIQEWDVGAPDQDDDVGRRLILNGATVNGAADVRHAARHDPSRVLAECAARRWLAETFRVTDYAKHNDPEILRRFAAVYADHPDYREEWKP
jgi:hypothetical protein